MFLTRATVASISVVFLFIFNLQVIENLETLTNLTSLFIGKNKITKIEKLETLVNLRTLSMQVGAGLEILFHCMQFYSCTLLPKPQIVNSFGRHCVSGLSFIKQSGIWYCILHLILLKEYVFVTYTQICSSGHLY